MAAGMNRLWSGSSTRRAPHMQHCCKLGLQLAITEMALVIQPPGRSKRSMPLLANCCCQLYYFSGRSGMLAALLNAAAALLERHSRLQVAGGVLLPAAAFLPAVPCACCRPPGGMLASRSCAVSDAWTAFALLKSPNLSVLPCACRRRRLHLSLLPHGRLAPLPVAV